MKKLIAWVDIPTTNFEKAVDFYSKLLNIEFKILDCGEEKMACFPSGEGAISNAPNFNPSKDGVLVSFCVDGNLNSVHEKVKKEGGKIVQQRTKIEAEGRGYFSVILDCEGNKVGLYED